MERLDRRDKASSTTERLLNIHEQTVDRHRNFTTYQLGVVQNGLMMWTPNSTEEFRRLYTQLEVLKQRNMKLGNRHLQHKLSDMIEAAQKGDLPDSSPSTPNLNGKRIVINLDDYHESTNV